MPTHASTRPVHAPQQSPRDIRDALPPVYQGEFTAEFLTALVHAADSLDLDRVERVLSKWGPRTLRETA